MGTCVLRKQIDDERPPTGLLGTKDHASCMRGSLARKGLTGRSFRRATSSLNLIYLISDRAHAGSHSFEFDRRNDYAPDNCAANTFSRSLVSIDYRSTSHSPTLQRRPFRGDWLPLSWRSPHAISTGAGADCSGAPIFWFSMWSGGAVRVIFHYMIEIAHHHITFNGRLPLEMYRTNAVAPYSVTNATRYAVAPLTIEL